MYRAGLRQVEGRLPVATPRPGSSRRRRYRHEAGNLGLQLLCPLLVPLRDHGLPLLGSLPLLLLLSLRPAPAPSSGARANELRVLIVHLSHDPPLERPRDVLDVHEVAEAAAGTARLMECTAPGLAEVVDWGELRLDEAGAIEAVGEQLHGALGRLLVEVLDIHVPEHVVGDIVQDNHVL